MSIGGLAEVHVGFTRDGGRCDGRRPVHLGRRVVASLAVVALAGVLVGEQAARSAGSASAEAAAVRRAVGPAHEVSPTRHLRPGYGVDPAVAFDGTNHLVVWEAEGIRAALVGPSGDVLDEASVLVDGGGLSSSPQVAFDGTNYLVVWATAAFGPSDIRGTVVSTGGQVLDPDGFTIAGGSNVEHDPTIGFDGVNHLVAWRSQDPQGSASLLAARISPVGVVLDGPRTVADQPATVGPVAFDGTNHLLTWTDATGLKAARLAPDATVRTPGFGLSAGNVVAGMDVAFDGVNWQVVWGESPEGPRLESVYGTRIDAAGTVLDPSPVLVARTAVEPRLDRTGDHVLIAWADTRAAKDVYGARRGRDGTMLDPVPFLVSQYQSVTEVSGGADQALITTDSGLQSVRAVRIDDAGTVLDPAPRPISFEANTQTGTFVASDGTDQLVAWSDNRDDPMGTVRVARMTPAGESLDPDGISINSAAGDDVTDVVFDGRNYIVGLERLVQFDNPRYEVLVAIVGTDGRLVTSEPVPVSTGPWSVGLRLSPDGTNTLAVWSDMGGGVSGARISPTGEVLAPGVFAISSPGEQAMQPAVAFDGTNHLVVYVSVDAGAQGVVARRVSVSGQVLDASARPIADTAEREGFPALAWSGRSYLAVWQSEPAAGGDARVVGARVSPDADVLDPGPSQISAPAPTQEGPTVASLNGWFLVLWSSERDGYRWDVFGARIHESGRRRDPDDLVVAGDARLADVTAGDDGLWRAAYTAHDDPATGVERVFGRAVSPK